MTSPLNAITLFVLGSAPVTGAAARPMDPNRSIPAMRPAILSPSSFKPYVDRFNREDIGAAPEKLSIPNAEAWTFMERNVPWFDCPDKQLEETYYYRWWTYRKHLSRTPDGWVVTEFLPNVPWAGIYNTISCAAGHHLYEGRWMRDPQYVDDYARFWFLPEALPRNYSFWAADAVRAVTLASGDPSLAQELLPNLVANYRAWETTNRDGEGLFKQADDRDGMEYSLGGSGYRPSINSYMFGDASAIAAIARQCGNQKLADEFRAKAAEIKGLVQSRLWNTEDSFFETAKAATALGSSLNEATKAVPLLSVGGIGERRFRIPPEGAMLLSPEAGGRMSASESGSGANRDEPGVRAPAEPENVVVATRMPYPSDLGLTGVREQIGFIPWYFNLPGPGYEDAWKQLSDPNGFAAPYGPTTAERRATGFMHPENHDCLWNGPSWPYATTQTLVAMANLLDNYPSPTVSRQDYFDLLRGYSRSQQKDGRPWIAEDLNADTGKWIVDLPRSVCYNHSGFADLVISGLVGLRPQEGDKLVVKPLVPQEEWSWFCLDGVPYHGHSVTILWDKDGLRYGQGSGLSLLVNGRRVAHRADLDELDATLPGFPGPTKGTMQTGWEKYPEPVLGGKLGTCFDISVLQDDGKFKMYFSWRPKHSIAVAESTDGIHWGEPRILIAPAKTGWEDDINRPGVVKHNGVYHMWYTGQFNGHSSIGYASSTDGLTWQRRDKPVLEAVQPWEKVAVMCPSVEWDGRSHQFRMWYSGGDQYEPDAIGFATSPDGVHWNKHEGPIFVADPHNRWERYKVTACQVVHWKGWQYMFYIGFRDIDHAQIGIARSRDGVSHWQRLKTNPIISPTEDGWDADACYKPFAIYDQATKRWLLWYNGRHGAFEQIGLASKAGPDLGF